MAPSERQCHRVVWLVTEKLLHPSLKTLPHRFQTGQRVKRQIDRLPRFDEGLVGLDGEPSSLDGELCKTADRNDFADHVEQSGKLIRREDGRSSASAKNGPNVVCRTDDATAQFDLDSIHQRGRVAIFHCD